MHAEAQRGGGPLPDDDPYHLDGQSQRDQGPLLSDDIRQRYGLTPSKKLAAKLTTPLYRAHEYTQTGAFQSFLSWPAHGRVLATAARQQAKAAATLAQTQAEMVAATAPPSDPSLVAAKAAATAAHRRAASHTMPTVVRPTSAPATKKRPTYTQRVAPHVPLAPSGGMLAGGVATTAERTIDPLDEVRHLPPGKRPRTAAQLDRILTRRIVVHEAKHGPARSILHDRYNHSPAPQLNSFQPRFPNDVGPRWTQTTDAGTYDTHTGPQLAILRHRRIEHTFSGYSRRGPRARSAAAARIVSRSFTAEAVEPGPWTYHPTPLKKHVESVIMVPDSLPPAFKTGIGAQWMNTRAVSTAAGEMARGLAHDSIAYRARAALRGESGVGTGIRFKRTDRWKEQERRERYLESLDPQRASRTAPPATLRSTALEGKLANQAPSFGGGPPRFGPSNNGGFVCTGGRITHGKQDAVLETLDPAQGLRRRQRMRKHMDWNENTAYKAFFAREGFKPQKTGTFRNKQRKRLALQARSRAKKSQYPGLPVRQQSMTRPVETEQEQEPDPIRRASVVDWHALTPAGRQANLEASAMKRNARARSARERRASIAVESVAERIRREQQRVADRAAERKLMQARIWLRIIAHMSRLTKWYGEAEEISAFRSLPARVRGTVRRCARRWRKETVKRRERRARPILLRFFRLAKYKREYRAIRVQHDKASRVLQRWWRIVRCIARARRALIQEMWSVAILEFRPLLLQYRERLLESGAAAVASGGQRGEATPTAFRRLREDARKTCLDGIRAYTAEDRLRVRVSERKRRRQSLLHDGLENAGLFLGQRMYDKYTYIAHMMTHHAFVAAAVRAPKGWMALSMAATKQAVSVGGKRRLSRVTQRGIVYSRYSGLPEGAAKFRWMHFASIYLVIEQAMLPAMEEAVSTLVDGMR